MLKRAASEKPKKKKSLKVMGQSLKCGKLKCLTSFCGRAGTVFEIDQSLQCGIKWLILFCGRAGSLFFGNRSDALMRQRKRD